MDSLFYIVVVMLIMLKLMIWVCVFYSRARRSQMARCQRGIILIQDGRRRVLVTGDCDSILNAEGVENPQVSARMPPSYEEVLRTKSEEAKPPSYDQVVQSTNTYQQSNTPSQIADSTGLPPYTPSPSVPELPPYTYTQSPNATTQQSYSTTDSNSNSAAAQPVPYQQSTNPA